MEGSWDYVAPCEAEMNRWYAHLSLFHKEEKEEKPPKLAYF